MPQFDMVAHLEKQIRWSEQTFGPGDRTVGILAHIRKELEEIEANPTDIYEWIDVIILACDGAWRAGWEPEDIVAALQTKHALNETRTWPDWRLFSDGQPIEHKRSTDG